MLGTPHDPTLTQLCSSRVLKYLRTWPKRQKMSWTNVFPRGNQDPQALDLIDKMLAFDPKHRPSAEEALGHPFLAAYHFPDDEPAHPKIFDFGFEAANSIPDIKSKRQMMEWTVTLEKRSYFSNFLVELILAEVQDFKAGQQKAVESDTINSPRRTA